MTAPAAITVWLIEDDAAFRTTIAHTIAKQPGFSCDGEFGRAEDALAALQTGPAPRIILRDVGLPGMSGIDAIPHLRERAPDTAMLVLTVFEDEEKIAASICAGASGCLLKNRARRGPHPRRAGCPCRRHATERSHRPLGARYV